MLKLRPWLWPAVAAAVALIALLAGLLLVDRWGEAVIARQQTAIAASARDYFVAFAHEEGVDALSDALNRHARQGSPDGFRYALVDRSGRMLAGADVVSSLDAPDAGWKTVTEPDSRPRRLWRVLAEPIGGGRTLIVAENLAARDALRGAVVRGSAVAALIAAMGAAAGGIVLNAILVHRTRSIGATAERIAGGDLSARAPVHPDGDVFDRLGAGVNAMLAQIEELMTGMRMVTDSVAHDLRSPLTRLKGALARAAEPEAPEASRLAALDQAAAEADRILATLNALLDIARAESGLSREMMRNTEVGMVAVELAELFSPAAEDVGQTLSVAVPPEPVVALAHPALLRQAIGNLLHNALTHAGPGTNVQLSVSQAEGGEVLIRVADDGEGIPSDQLGRVQQRFVRLETARGPTAGSGLGLALVAACAKLHGGQVMLEDNTPGLRATLALANLRS